MLVVLASCCLHTLTAPEHVSMFVPLALLFLLLSLLLLLLLLFPPCLLLLFFPFFSLVVLLFFSSSYVAVCSVRVRSRKNANDSCSCARSFPDHRRLHSSRCMQSTSSACRRQAALRYIQNYFTASYLISLLLSQCFAALWIHSFMTAQCLQSMYECCRKGSSQQTITASGSMATHLQNEHVSPCTVRHPSRDCMPSDGCLVYTYFSLVIFSCCSACVCCV